MLSPSLVTLRRLAGTTEREFLTIGSEMQGIYLRSTELSQAARDLVEVASGERLHTLIDQLRQMLHEMESYLWQTQQQSAIYSSTLHSVEGLLVQVAKPLEGFRKMSKNLYILEVLIKIESVHLGEMGGEFMNLAQDIKKLSQLIKEKSNTIQFHRLQLASMIGKNTSGLHAATAMQESSVQSTLINTETGIGELEAANQRVSQLGNIISTISRENSENVSDIVQSMQFHDIFRQQVEHVAETLECLMSSLSKSNQEPFESPSALKEMINKVGDLCELQEAQLQFASTELYNAVTSIVSNLSEIGEKQKLMAQEIFSGSGVVNASGNSFIDGVSHHMTTITGLLASCAETNDAMVAIMREVTAIVGEITSFVADIENIGGDIIQIALNARIKAACTGLEGASMCVLAEEIGHLSHEDMQRTRAITQTLMEIQNATSALAVEADNSELNLGNKLTSMKQELSTTLAILEAMEKELLGLLVKIQKQADALTVEIEKLTGSIDVHERTKAMADEVLENLKQIYGESRALYPASATFKEDLRTTAERYTMESERRIHEDIARKHGVESIQLKTLAFTNGEDAEFGDNVDLF